MLPHRHVFVCIIGLMTITGCVQESARTTQSTSANPTPMPAHSGPLDWAAVQRFKLAKIQLAAQHAMDQQQAWEAATIPIPFPEQITTTGQVKILAQSAQALELDVLAAPQQSPRPNDSEAVRLVLPQPLVLQIYTQLNAESPGAQPTASGIAFQDSSTTLSSPEVRLGCRIIGSNGKSAVIEGYIPALQAWGEQAHEVYLDWSLIAYGKNEEKDVIAVLSSVAAIELTMAAVQRAPSRGPSNTAQLAHFTVSNLRVVDYLKGSYDPSRQGRVFDEKLDKWLVAPPDFTLQQRVQEITGAVAIFGGDAGVHSAIMSLDHTARTQCWDGSFLDGRRGARTVASGEFTYGFTTYGMLCAYEELERIRSPALDEHITIGVQTLPRRQQYQRMFYREAMSRTATLPAEYRDDIIDSDKLKSGANRVLGYVMSMRMVADILTDPLLKQRVLDHYRPAMLQIAAAQGRYSGGFPILGEGNLYDDQGIHYDAGYIRTHMDWLIVGVQRTGDPLLVDMLRRYQPVFAAVMDQHGTGLLELISERTAGGKPAQLILPDATSQVGIRHKLPIIAQWGHNCGLAKWQTWSETSGNHWTYAGHIRGYPLGAHIGRLVDDFHAEPEPKDLGYVFPRQWPIWSSRISNKTNGAQRHSTVTIASDGSCSTDFQVAVGEFIETVGVPVQIKVLTAGASITARATALTGWPKLLPANARCNLVGSTTSTFTVGQPVQIRVDAESHWNIDGPLVTLPAEAGGEIVPFHISMTLAPLIPDSVVDIEITVLREPIPYNMTMWKPEPPVKKPASD